MKVALCFYGQPRFYDNVSIKTFMHDIRKDSNLEVDVFMHLWKPTTETFMRSPWSNIADEFAKIDTTNLEDRIKEIYSPKSILIEEERVFVQNPQDYKRTPAPSSPETVHRMYYSQWKVGEMLKESGNSYDLVFRMRTDSTVMSLIPLQNLNTEKVWVPDNCPVLGWFNDNFSISSQENFLKLVGTYNNINKFYTEGADMNGEPMLKKQAKETGIFDKVTKNRKINVGLYRGGNPPVSPRIFQGVWINEEFKQIAHVQDGPPK